MAIIKPRLFIGSSTEAVGVAAAIQAGLHHDAEITIWHQNIFEHSTGILESLEDKLSCFDFAAFVLAPDDFVRSRDDQALVARDNVIFESGLFMGRLGRRKVFLVRPLGTTLRLPTDLAGVTVLEYDTNRRDGNLVAALGPACYSIQLTLKDWTPIAFASLAINPNYESDMEFLDGSFKLDKLITAKTLFIITAEGIISELLDRPSAAFLRDVIASRHRQRAIIISDSKWMSDEKIRPNPAISIGSERANKVTGFVRDAPDAKSWKNDRGQFGAFLHRNNNPLVALWGYTALATRQAVESYIDDHRGLAEFLQICATPS
jgi:Predicted nucleotide-binding protein containing TIR-like domain